MRLHVLALALAAAAAGVTWLALRDPSLVTSANALLLWVWATVAWRAAVTPRHAGPVCLGCGTVAPGWLPDGSCMRCAQPRKPALARPGDRPFG